MQYTELKATHTPGWQDMIVYVKCHNDYCKHGVESRKAIAIHEFAHNSDTEALDFCNDTYK